MPKWENLSEKKRELLDNARLAKEELKYRVSTGKQLYKHIYDDDQVLYVFETREDEHKNKYYGYAVCKEDGKEPYYYVEGTTYIEEKDAEKKTDSNGIALRYSGPKSMIQRNMLGMFSEYINEGPFEGYYISIKAPNDSEYKVESRYKTDDYGQDCISVFNADFATNEVYFVNGAMLKEKAEKPTIIVGCYHLTENCDFDLDRVVDEEEEECIKEKMIYGSNVPLPSREEIEKLVYQGNVAGASLLYPMFATLDIPMPDGVTDNSSLLNNILAGKNVNSNQVMALFGKATSDLNELCYEDESKKLR